MTHFFYQYSNLITLSKDDYYHCFFRSTSHIFAERSTDSQQKQELKLLTTDTKNSIIYAYDGVEQEDCNYTVFGHSETLPLKRTRQGFNGEFLDQLLGAYQLGQGYRTYSPGLMRFQSPDDLSPFARGGVNCYAYCGGDPVNYTDPTGHVYLPLQKGRPMKASRHSAPAPSQTPHRATLKRKNPHASGLEPPTKYGRPSENHFEKIGEPDVFESIISNLTLKDAIAFKNTSVPIGNFVGPIIDRYISLAVASTASRGAARAGVLPGVPKILGQSLGLGLSPHLRDINSLSSINMQAPGSIRNFIRLLNYGVPVVRTDLVLSGRNNSLRGE